MHSTETDCGSCSVDPKVHHGTKRSLAVCEHIGEVLGDFILVFYRDICPEDSLIRGRNYITTETANAFSRRGPGFIENKKFHSQSGCRLGHGRTRLGSGLRAVALRCLSRENAGRTMSVLHKAL